MAFPCTVNREMKVLNIFLFFLSFLILFLFLASARESSNNVKHYIVYMGLHSFPHAESVIKSNHELLSSVLGRNAEEAGNDVIHHYHKSFRGFSAMITPQEANELKKHDSVVSVFESRNHHLATTRSWDFMQQHMDNPNFNEGLSKTLRYKSRDVVVGHLDSGIWPEAKAFRDRGLKPVPKYFRGTCVQGNNFTSSSCNRKIIGARYYYQGYESEKGKLENSGQPFYRSARDDFGHGTYTASIAAGAGIGDVSLPGMKNQLAIGGAPHARLSVYKVCWFNYCSCADILKAYDDAIMDNVDVITMSITSTDPDSATNNYFEDCISIGSYHAFRNGIVVVAAAGNSEIPAPGSVANVAPWMTTVAASTIDRQFVHSIQFGDKSSLMAQAQSHLMGPASGNSLPALQSFHQLQYAFHARAADVAVTDASYCMNNTLNPGKVRGKIVICSIDGVNDDTVAKAAVVKQAGGVGMIIIQEKSEAIIDAFAVPTAIIGQEGGLKLQEYMSKAMSKAVAKISPAKALIQTMPAPKMASFSSIGPNPITPDIIKPDITAPGFNILAAIPPAVGQPNDALNYGFHSGTSVAAPHVAGLAAVLQSVNKRWSVSAIKSALMTSAFLFDNTGNPIRAGDNTLATPFEFGSGHLDPDRAMTPGLVYEVSDKDILDFLCSQTINSSKLHSIVGKSVKCNPKAVPAYQLNYPTISISTLNKTISVKRTVTFISPRNGPQFYQVFVEKPQGVDVKVHPKVLDFSGGVKKLSYTVQFTPERTAGSGYSYGSITWRDGRHSVRSAIAVNVSY